MKGNLSTWCAGSLRSIAAAWDHFWFTPTSASLLGIIRVLVGGMVFYTHLVWSLELLTFFSPNGVLPRDYSRLLYENAWSHWTHFDWLQSAGAIWTVHLVGLVVMLMFAVGFCTRVTGVLTFLLVVSYAHRATGALFGLDQINAFLTLYLAIGPAGERWSLDRLLGGSKRGDEPRVSANVSLRLMQVHMCVVYLFAGMAKLQGPAWWQGDALWGALASLDYQTLDLVWLASYPALIEALTLVTLAWEVSYGFLIWHPRWRPIYLAMAVLVHGGIGLAMGMITFGLIMIFGNLAFLPPDLGSTWGRRNQSAAGGQGRGVPATP